jgi:hypothetical protein
MIFIGPGGARAAGVGKLPTFLEKILKKSLTIPRGTL